MFDYDWGLQDDFMGSARLLLTSIDINVSTTLTLKLEDSSNIDKDMGELILNVVLLPKTQEDKEQVSINYITAG